MATEIIINLNDDRDAYVLSDPKDIIHVNELEQVRQLLEASVREAKKYENADKAENSFKRKHDTIMLAGVRGSGKTTFMLSILNFIKKGIDGTTEVTFKFEGRESIEVLNIFDPTLIEDKVHVFINIVSMIKDRVDDRTKKANCFRDIESDDCKSYKEWEKSFKKLADGLPAINGVGHDGFSGDEWADSEFIMDKGIGRAHAANHLERNFHDFVRKSLRFLGKTAFLLCFDDIDTNFGKGWPVLEVLHKYLTTPQFITILSGDAHLYSILIRDKQWGNFSDRLLKMETVTKAERTEYKDTVAHLEEQYFMKLLKQERRVFLSSLYQKIQYDGNTVIEIGIDEKNNKELYIMYSELMDKLGTEKSDRKDSFRFLASQPLRTQKQLLYAFHKSQRDLDQSIIDIFWTDLASKKIDVSSLRNAPQHVTIHILDYLVRNNIISEGFGLAPIFSDPLMNGAQFALSAITSEQLYKDPTLVFDYWLRVCMAREMSKLMGDRAIAKGEGPSLQNFIDHCALNQSKATRYLARHSTAYMRAFRGYNFELKKMNLSKYEQGAWHGTLPLYARAEKSKDGQHSETDKIDYVLDVADPFVRIIGAMPLSGATDHNRRALPIYSIYNLLGILGQLISKARENAYDPKVTYKKVAGILYWNAQFREYPLPSWASSFTSEPSENDDYGINELVTIDKLYEFSKSMTNWALINLKYNISTSMLGNVFTRLFYTLNNLDKGLPSPLLADWFHRTIIIFLHSVLTVEAMDQLDITGLGLLLTNPVKSDKVFIINLNKLVTEKIHENSDQLLFSKWILSCPIWELFLDHSDTNLIANISAYTAPFLKSHTPAPATPAPAQPADATPADATPADATPADLSPITTEINIWSQFNVYNNISKSLVLVKGNEQIIKEESITGEAVVTKIKTNFISNRKAHLADLKKFLAGKAVSKDDVLNMQNQVLADFMKEGLGDKYTIRLKVASAIKDRIVAGRLTWP